MTYPKWILNFLAAYGVNLDAFKAEAQRLSDKLGAPVEWQDAMGAWINENTSLSPEKALAFLTLAYAEFTSGNPGYDSEHGGGA